MIFDEKRIELKDGQTAILRSPNENDAEGLLDFIKAASGETEFLMKYPEEFEGFTVEDEQSFINDMNSDKNGVMIACFVDERVIGNCQITFHAGMKDRHRADVAIAILQEYWGLGIGTRLFTELITLAKERNGVRQIELDFIEGNTRARALYEKLGFRITGVKPDAICLKDGTMLNEYMMVRKL